jgi:hypothetical protein
VFFQNLYFNIESDESKSVCIHFVVSISIATIFNSSARAGEMSHLTDIIYLLLLTALQKESFGIKIRRNLVAADGILIFIQLSTILQLKGVTCILKRNVQRKLNDTEIKGVKLKNKRQNIFGFVTIFKIFARKIQIRTS